MSDFPTNPEESSTSPFPYSIFDSPNPSREEVAKYVMDHAGQIRRRIRGKIAAYNRRDENKRLATFDEDDILSTLCRRLDAAIYANKFRTLSEPEFWSYVNTITENAILERLRRSHRHLPLDPSNDLPSAPCIDSHKSQHEVAASLAECFAAAPTPVVAS